MTDTTKQPNLNKPENPPEPPGRDKPTPTGVVDAPGRQDPPPPPPEPDPAPGGGD